MNPDQQIALLANQVRQLSEEVAELRRNPFTPINMEMVRTQLGIGFIGTDSTTVATGALIVNSKEGPIKILRA
jgi:hypothetical protein